MPSRTRRASTAPSGAHAATRGFIERHGLWTDQDKQAADDVRRRIERHDLKAVRIGWPDQHGIVRGKTLLIEDFLESLENGRDFQGAVLNMDTTNNPFASFFAPGGGVGIAELDGSPDVVLVPDPGSFRILPWAPGTGWVLSDMYLMNGKPVEISARRVMRKMLDDLAQLGYEYRAGLEVEFYITRLEDRKLMCSEAGWPPDPPTVSVIAHGYQYLTENHNDEIDEILQALREALVGAELPLRSMEDEWGPGQCEFTFSVETGLQAADSMILFRTATKQVCHRLGYHATFMCRPGLPNFFSSGWHLHQSLRDTTGSRDVFASDGAEPLSATGEHFLAGILEHATASCVFTTPTINGYKRYKPNSLAPVNVSWGVENRSALIRVIGEPRDPSTHLENRGGEPAANPYLYMASQIAAGVDGIRRKLDPGPPVGSDAYVADRPPLPNNLSDAVAEMKESKLFRGAFGTEFIDYMARLKEAEWGRFMSAATDWEQREYFEVF
jgi:glutamine synthetase